MSEEPKIPDGVVVAYVVRHFPTAMNEGRERLRGQLNEPIDTEQAELLAPAVAAILERLGVDCLYCSNLQRGKETARAIARYMPEEVEIEIRDGFLTWDTGKYTGQLRDKVWATVEKYIANPEIKVPGDERFDGEAFNDLLDRWRRELLYQVKDAAENNGKNAWIEHGNLFWTMIPLLEGRQPGKSDHVAPKPGSVFRLEMTSDTFRLALVYDASLPEDSEDEDADNAGKSIS